MNSLCEDCNITLSYFENSVINYSTNGQQLLFTTDFIYSNPRGTVTSTSLIHHFQSWILSQNTPNLTVAGKTVTINKNCPVTINTVTSKVCLKVFHESSEVKNSVSSTDINWISIIAGIIGVFVATLTIIITTIR